MKIEASPDFSTFELTQSYLPTVISAVTTLQANLEVWKWNEIFAYLDISSCQKTILWKTDSSFLKMAATKDSNSNIAVTTVDS